MAPGYRRASRLVSLLAVACVATRLAPAQLADWGAIKASPSATIALEQSWCSVRDGNTIDAFSCFTRTWTRLVTQGAPSVVVLNDCFLVQDTQTFFGTSFYGYCPRTGRFAAQHAWSPGACIEAPVSPQSWLAVVTDGEMVHVFQALEGTWTTFKVAGTPLVTMGTNCAIVDDGVRLYGVSAFYGTPVALDAGGASVVGAYGSCGIASSAGLVHGFSAYKNTWASLPVTATPSATAGNIQAAFVSLHEGTGAARAVFFSGHTGRFTTQTVTPLASVLVDRAVAIVTDLGTVYGYSGLLGKVAPLSVAATPSVAMQQFFALVEDGGRVSAFSANAGAFAPSIAATNAEIQTRAEIAVHEPSTSAVATQVYSQFLNKWTATPPLTAAKTHVTAAAVVLEESNGGLHGLSMRGTSWVFQATPALDQVFVGSSRPGLEMTLVAKAGTSLWAFNSRTEAWRMTTTSAPVTMFQGNNAALITLDGTRAYGFGSWTDRWSSVALGGPVVRSSAQVQSAYVDDGTMVHAFSGIGQVSASHDYPEYWRLASLGARMRIDLAAEPGSLGILLVSLAPASIPIPPWGTLLIDPGVMATVATPILGPERIFGFNMQVPEAPAFSGLDLHFQAAVFPTGTPYLTNAVAVRLL